MTFFLASARLKAFKKNYSFEQKPLDMERAGNVVCANMPPKKRIVSFERKFYEQSQTREGGSSGEVEVSGCGKRKLTKSGCSVGGVSGGRVEKGSRSAIERIGRSAVEGSRDGQRKITTSDRNAVEAHGGGVEGGKRGAIEGIDRGAVEVRGGRVEGGVLSAVKVIGRGAVEVRGGRVEGGVRGAVGAGRGAVEVRGSRVKGGVHGAVERIGRDAAEVRGGRVEGGIRGAVEGTGGGAVAVHGGGVEGGKRGAVEGIGRGEIEVRGGRAEGGVRGAVEGIGQRTFDGSRDGKRKLTKSDRAGVEVIGGGFKGGAPPSGAIEGIGPSAIGGSGDRQLKHSKDDRNAVEVSGGGVKRSASGAVVGIGRIVVERSGDGTEKITKGYRSAVKVRGDDKGKLNKSFRSAVEVSGGGVMGGANGAVEVSGFGVMGGENGAVEDIGRSAVESIDDGKEKLTKSGCSVGGVSGGAIEGVGRSAVEEIDDGKRKLTKSGPSVTEVSGVVAAEECAIASGAVEEIGQSGVGGRPQLNRNDALLYLAKVKRAFAENMEMYDWFIDLMWLYKDRRFDIDGVNNILKEKFKAHPDLIAGFNGFLPKGQEIPIPEKKPVFQDGVNYLRKIKGRFGDDHHVYKSFVAMIKKSKTVQKTITQVYEEVAIMFEGYPEFIEEFKKFLPEDK